MLVKITEGGTAMKKKLITLAMGTALVMGLTACGGSSDTNTTKEKGSTATGQEIYSKSSCAGCHGSDLQGGAGGTPALKNVGAKYSKDEILDIIKNGKNQGRMPGGLLKGSDAEKVATWLSEKK